MYGHIDIKDDLRWRPAITLQEQRAHQAVNGRIIAHDALVAMCGGGLRIAQIQSVEGAWRGQRLAAVLLPAALFAVHVTVARARTRWARRSGTECSVRAGLR